MFLTFHKTPWYWCLQCSLLLCLTLLLEGCMASNQGDTQGTGSTKEQLQQCPSSPNCVCSEFQDLPYSVAPLAITGTSDEAWQNLQTAISLLGGVVESDDGTLLHATFRSRIFGFIDDLNCRLDTTTGVIHIRSASRVGHYDFGVNRKRIERLRETFQQASQPHSKSP